MWHATKFVDRVPTEVTLRRVEEGTLPGIEMECKALPGQCGVMGRDQFESLLQQPFPADVSVPRLMPNTPPVFNLKPLMAP